MFQCTDSRSNPLLTVRGSVCLVPVCLPRRTTGKMCCVLLQFDDSLHFTVDIMKLCSKRKCLKISQESIKLIVCDFCHLKKVFFSELHQVKSFKWNLDLSLSGRLHKVYMKTMQNCLLKLEEVFLKTYFAMVIFCPQINYSRVQSDKHNS